MQHGRNSWQGPVSLLGWGYRPINRNKPGNNPISVNLSGSARRSPMPAVPTMLRNCTTLHGLCGVRRECLRRGAGNVGGFPISDVGHDFIDGRGTETRRVGGVY